MVSTAGPSDSSECSSCRPALILWSSSASQTRRQTSAGESLSPLSPCIYSLCNA